MDAEEKLDWERFRELAERVLEQGEPLDLNDEARAILRGNARSVAISPEDAEEALRSVSSATTLLREIARRIRQGSLRGTKAYRLTDRLLETGDFAGARKVLEDVLAVEVVPFYREQRMIHLEYLETLEAVYSTGHVEEDFHPWGQIRVLALRVQQGKPLELREDLRNFLRQTAPSVAISETEADASLTSVQGAEALLAKMLERIEDGKQRISRALDRMILCEQAGDLEGARQPLREVLAVEAIPQYRGMAEENLERLNRPPQAS